MADTRRLLRMIANLRGYESDLVRLARLSKAELVADPDKLASAKYHLQVAVQCCIDMALHIIGSECWRPPDSYAEAMTVLVENGVLPAAKEDAYRSMVGLRNRLVHSYFDVDKDMVYTILQEHLGDLKAFRLAVAACGADDI